MALIIQLLIIQSPGEACCQTGKWSANFRDVCLWVACIKIFRPNMSVIALLNQKIHVLSEVKVFFFFQFCVKNNGHALKFTHNFF